MKRYVMSRTGDDRDRGHRGKVQVLVEVLDEEGRHSDVYHLPHLVRHSPDGFEWGYGGSGPADLARSIVGDLTGEEDPHPADYQEVKWSLLNDMHWDGGEVTEVQVTAVLEAVRAAR